MIPERDAAPYAVVQLRQENLRADSYNLVGFQNHLKFGEQARVLRLIPGLENAKFLRYGQIHRNTYINAPTLLTETLQHEAASERFFRRADFRAWKATPNPLPRACWWECTSRASPRDAGGHAPRETALGSLVNYLTVLT